MSKEASSLAAFPGIAEMQEFWQSALTHNGASWPKAPLGDLAGFQAASVKWMSHRQADFNKSLEAFRQISACKDPTEAIALQQKWFTDSMQSLMSDWMALMSPAAFSPQTAPKSPAERPISVKKAQE